MAEELMQIDRSALEQLARIRGDEETLRERLARAEASKSKVSPVVYARVISDYRTKLDDIERRAQPLKDTARREYAKLKGLAGEYGKALESVTIDREELDFRNQLGEFTEKEFAAKMAELEKKVAEERSRVDAAAALKNEFVSAFFSEDELEAVPLPLPEPPAEEPAPAAQGTRHRRHLTVPHTVPSTMPLSEPAPSAPAPTDIGSETIATRVAPPLAPEVKAKVTRITDSGATTVLTMPRLVAILDGQLGDEYVLKPRTSIGRTSKNDIQVLDDSVSRTHCEVVMGKDGYHVVDLGSHNGIAVNGEKVSERVLADGDIVDVGTRRFIFRFG